MTATDFAVLITKFLTEYLPLHRNCSKNTISSYKDSLKLFILFLRDGKSMNINKFKMHQINRELILEFIEWLENRGNSPVTINHRLAGIKSFINFAQYESVENLAYLQPVLSVKSLKTTTRQVDYLTEEQMNNLINLPHIDTSTGIRHRIIMCLLYDTGARVQELCDLKIEDINLGNNPTVKLHGKGSKIRIVPISKNMNQILEVYISKFFSDIKLKNEYLIKNKNNQQMSRDGIEYIVQKYATILKNNDPSFPSKVHPHMFRHSKAMHMLAVDIPIVYIRDFLGHEDISTTMIYARADSRKKNEAINNLAPKLIEENYVDWSKEQDLLDFLNSFK
jgi:integrase/recombinase XerD